MSADPTARPRPAIDRDTASFWAAASRHVLVVQECGACGALAYPPEVSCASCGSLDLANRPVAGTGVLHSFTVVHHPPAPGFEHPRVVGLVALDEGPRVVAGIVDCDRAELAVGMRLEVCWLDTHPATGDLPAISVPQFRPATPSAASDTAASDTAAPDTVAPPVSEQSSGSTAPATTWPPGPTRPRTRPRFAGRTAIVGIGATDFSVDSGRSELRLAVEACRAAITDSGGLDPAEITGLVTFTMDTNPEDQVMRSVGLTELTHFSRVHFGGGGACGALHLAAMAVDSGAADAVMVYRAFNERSSRRFGAGIGDRAPLATAEAVQFSWTSPHGLLTPASWAAMIATRHLHERGLTSEDLGHVSVAARAFAATNPAARFHGRPITLDDHQSSRWIAEPLRLFDCCLETDGAVAFVVTSLERARDLDVTPVVVSGAVQQCTRDLHLSRAPFNNTYVSATDLAGCARQLWDTTGLTPAHIDAAMLYDAFTPQILAQLEAFDLNDGAGPGEMVRAGEIGPGGRLPVNTHGGQIGEAYLHGLNNITEAVRQLRGTAANQLDAPEHVLVTASGYMPTSAAILSADH